LISNLVGLGYNAFMDSQSASVPGPFKVSLQITGPLSWAGFRSGIPFLDLISIHNDGDLVARDLTLELSCVPPFFAPFRQPLAPINPAMDSAIFKPDLVIDDARVCTLVEATDASVTARILWNGKDVGSTATPLRALAYNEWIKTLRNDLIAAFVLPNHPRIKELVAEARDLQSNLFGNPSFEGYQSRSPERVTQQAHAIFSAIQQRGVTYLGVPPSFEEHGQKLRFPDSLKQEKQGNCIELATWFAAALEACGLKPVVILMQGHALSGFWLEETTPNIGSIETDAATVRKLVSAKKLVLVETTATTNRPAIHFVEACALGHEKIVDDTFLALIDVSSARAQGVRPLPTQDEPADIVSPGVPVTTFDASLPSIAIPAGRTPGESKGHSRIDSWTDSLLDLTLRNDLLGLTLDENPNAWNGLRPKRKGLSLAIPDLADFENAFADGEKFDLSMEPLEIPKGGVTQEFRDYVQKRVDKNILCVDLGTLDAKPKVRDLWKRHTMGIEERGTSPIHVALGFLKWFESENATPRYAPLLLLPTQIERNSLGASFTIAAGDGETVFNTALVQKLRNDFKIDLSGLASNLPEDESGIDVERVFYDVTQAVMSLKRFEVVHLAMLGPFEYRKQVMAKDLKDIANAKETSPNDFLCRLEPRFASNSRNMVSVGGDDRPFARPQELDDLIPPADLPLVVDCDSSQLLAVHAAMSGRSFVLHGPPGTGKSQTISNMIACLLSSGKRVLFVAEKRAALSVVARRLDRVGLGTACLELHSEKSDPSHVAASLVEALDEVRIENIGRFDSFARNVAEERKKLNQFVRLLHAPTPLGKSYYKASARRHELRDIAAPAVEHPNHLETTEEEFERRIRTLQALSRSIGDCGGWSNHPFRASRLTVWTEKKQDAVDTLLKDLEDAGQALTAVQATAAKAFSFPLHLVEVAPGTFVSMARFLADAPPSWVRELATLPSREDYLTAIGQLCLIAKHRAERLDSLSTRWNESLHDLDLPDLAEKISTASTKWFLAKWFALRGPKAKLSAVSKGPLDNLDSLLRDLKIAQEARKDARELDGASQSIINLMGPAFVGAKTQPTVFELATKSQNWSQAILALNGVARQRDLAGLDPQTPVPRMEPSVALDIAVHLEQSIAKLRTSADRVVEALLLVPHEAWGSDDPVSSAKACAAFATSARKALPSLRDKTTSEDNARIAQDLGLGTFLSHLREGAIPEDKLALWYEAGFLRTWINEMMERHAILAQFRGREHDRLIDSFRADDRQLLEAGKFKARCEVMRRRPPPAVETHAESEVGILRREYMKKRRRFPVRRLLTELRTLVPKLKPCFLMSPLAVSHFLPVDCEKFDTVVFDEASQVRTADAIGALWRGKQVIVVGDSKQMPPTIFFGGSGPDDEDDEIDLSKPADTESILDEAVVSGVPALMLEWHYRSRDEKLIAFSNHHYYGGRLITFPAASAESEGCGLESIQAGGTYEMGKTRCNRMEADRVVSIIVNRLLDPTLRDRSMGVVTFNSQQQDLIEKLLEFKQKEHPELEAYFSGMAPERLFVKNLENVQGDERDVMIFSTTFGKDPAGKLSMNFGPMNKPGGERRLNVAITRARERLIVVTSLEPEDIDLSRTAAVGVKHLREFLAFVRDGKQALFRTVMTDSTARCDSPFEVDVLNVCQALHWKMETQVGCSGYKIDLAIVDPRAPGRYVLGIECDGATYHSGATARDRDRLRQSVLEGLGWTFHRIWSTDWRLNRNAEIDRLKSAYDRACAKPPRPRGNGTNADLQHEVQTMTEVQPFRPATVMTVASKTRGTPLEAVDPKEVTDDDRRSAILLVLKESGSMPRGALVQAAANNVGHRRVGTRIKTAFESALDGLLREGRVRELGDRLALP
jgi:very-short-patch-repair endonuclease